MQAKVKWRQGVKEEWSDKRETGYDINISGKTHPGEGGIDPEVYELLFQQIICDLKEIRVRSRNAVPNSRVEILSVEIDQGD